MMAAGLAYSFEKGCILVAKASTSAEWIGSSTSTPLERLTNCTAPMSNIKNIGRNVLIRLLMKHTPQLEGVRVSITLWLTVAISFLLRPKPEFISIIEKTLSQTEWYGECRNSIIGIHVRHSDKNEEARLIPFQSYLTEITRWEKISHTRAKCLFIATDDLKLRKYIINAKLLVSPVLNSSSFKAIVIKKDAIRGLSTLEQILLEIHILSRAQTLAFTFSSNFGRLAMFINPENLVKPFLDGNLPKIIPLDFYHRVKFGPRSMSYGFFFFWTSVSNKYDSSWKILPVLLSDVPRKLHCNPSKDGCSYSLDHLDQHFDLFQNCSKACSCCKLFKLGDENQFGMNIGPNLREIFPQEWLEYIDGSE